MPGGKGELAGDEQGAAAMINRAAQLAEVREDLISWKAVVRTPCRPRETRTRRRNRIKAEMLEHAGAANVPWIRQEEAAALVQLAEACSLFSRRSAHRDFPLLFATTMRPTIVD
jgi:hypothetical protein